MDISTIIFFAIVIGLLLFFIVYLPTKNKQPRREDMIAIDDETNAEPWKLCEEFHRIVWLKLGAPMEIEPRGSGEVISYKFLCPICERYR